jgi:predicted O-methyltransferase YrrM
MKALEAVQDPEKAIRYLVNKKFGTSTDYFDSVDETQYLLWLHKMYEQIDEVPGHIVEIGTGPGTNAIMLGHIIQIYNDENIRHYYGFDTFSGYTDEALEDAPHLDDERWRSLDIDSVRYTLDQCGVGDVTTLIEGDVKKTLPGFIEEDLHSKKSPGNFHIAFVYIDCNSYRATKTALDEMYEYISPGGRICVDELKQGGEIRALKEFCAERNLPFKKGSSPVAWAPYTIKQER